MSAIRLGAATNVQGFQNLLNALATHEDHVLNLEALQDEFGRFRVWCGNLGVLQKGHSSLDYRLRDAPLLSNEVTKLLNEQKQNLTAAYDIVTGARLPYEQQTTHGDDSQDDEDDFFSEDEDEESDLDAPETELNMRFQEIVDIVDNLYKISVRIRAPTVRTRSLKAASYRPKDPETGVDLLDQYAVFDNQHIQDLIRHLRRPHISADEIVDEGEDLIMRLARGVTLRRRQFKYWRRHRDKLGISTVLEEPQVPAAIQRPEAPHRHNTLEAQPGTPGIEIPRQAPSQKTGRTLLSGTEATHHHQSLDDIVDSKSVTSYAITVKDLSGKGIDLPPPPKAADGEKDFECPYCFMICPARYGRGRPWRTHVLQDLQPYVCTYPECKTPDQLFRSRRDWVEHESSHRKAWRCPEHPNAVYKSHTGLEEHLRNSHGSSISEGQLPSIVKVGETYTVDLRQKCPICCASVDMEGMGTLENHIANHLERIAAFSLPIDADDDSDGGSSRASRGGTESSAISTSSDISDPSEDSYEQDDDVEAPFGMDVPTSTFLGDNVMPTGEAWQSIEEAAASNLGAANDGPSSTAPELRDEIQRLASMYQMRQQLKATYGSQTQSNTDGKALLSESLIKALPDDSGQRLNLLFPKQEEDAESDDSLEKSLTVADTAIEEHMAERDAFRMYLLMLPGAQSVRFYKRYGSWNGNINFKDGDFAAMAMQTFDKKRYPKVRLRQKDAKKETLKFTVLQYQQAKQVSFSSEVAVAQASPPASGSSGTQQPPMQRDTEVSPILAVNDIPNLRALYRSDELAPRDDHSYAPNDRYNEIISFCYYDITRLQTDAIVNSTNRSLVPSRAEWTLNSIVHKAAGPGLEDECSRLNKLRVSQSVLTDGYQLPCNHIIHVARPHYASSKGMGQYNLLTEGYRSALRLAMNQNLKTIAFCCLGTGGVGFPARMAARIALQEAREFLEAHPQHPFERLVFCVYSDRDSEAYTDFFPLYFPPTHEDLDAITKKGSNNGTRLNALIQEVYTQVDKVTKQVKTFSVEATNMPQRVAQELSSISVLLESFKELVLRPGASAERLLTRTMRYLDLLCSVIFAICGNVTEMVELAKGKEDLGQPSHKVIWDDYNKHMQTYQGLTIVQLVDICQEFTQHLNTVLEQDVAIPHEMKTIGIRLGAWLTKQTGKGPDSIHEHFEEVILTREYQRDAAVTDRTETVKLYQIPTLAQLYPVGVLQPKDTQVTPSTRSNDVICLLREDITKLEVDILVNSTDTHSSGMGRLDRTVFLRGGSDLQEEFANHIPCNEGEIILTRGYSLPVKHVLHAIPPAIYRADTKDILRDMYRKILHMSSYLKATSIAIPSLGTGMLNYPRYDSAAIAIEEVKRFLESMDESNSVEKIVFVVYSSSDDFVYKSLIPVYFPPLESNLDQTKASQPDSSPPCTILGTLGDAFRGVISGRQPVDSNKRKLGSSEEDVVIAFETHAQGCSTCNNIPKVYAEGKDLCDDGYKLAAHLLRYLYMKEDQSVHSLRPERDEQEQVDVPGIYPLSLQLLNIVEKSFRDPDRDRPFVSNQPSLGLKIRKPEFTVHKIEVTVHPRNGDERTFGRLYVWSDPSRGWVGFQAPEPTLHLTRGAVVIREAEQDNAAKPTTWLNLTPRSTISKYSSTNILVDNINGDKNTVSESGSRFVLKCRSQIDCEMLLTRVQHAANSPTGAEPEKAYAQVSIWSHTAQKWEVFSPADAEEVIYIEPGRLEMLTSNFHRLDSSRTRVRLTSDSTIKTYSGAEIVLDNVTTEGESPTEFNRYMLRCRSKAACDMLLPRLIHAAENTGPNSRHQNSPVVGPVPEQDVTSLQPIASDMHNFQEDIETWSQRWEARGEHLGQQTQPELERELPSVPTEDPVKRPESATGDTWLNDLQEHIWTLNNSRNATVDEEEFTEEEGGEAKVRGTIDQYPIIEEIEPRTHDERRFVLVPEVSGDSGPEDIHSTRASSDSRDKTPSFQRSSVDPNQYILTELDIEDYFEHAVPPPLGMLSSPRYI